MKKIHYDIVTLPAYRAMGMKWIGPYSDVSQLKEVIHTMEHRVEELKDVINPNIQLGLSYHTRNDGFEHYSVFEVKRTQPLLEGMVELYVPEMTYFVTTHQKGEMIGQTYEHIQQWLAESDYKPFQDPNRHYYDPLPIKHERYPKDRDLQDPHFEIFIPITTK
ncbi:GyrI-like domain-containing protein [Shouchella clausii]|uniref:GyrI-like domain-containing protein n=1 Tax=Shouchella clausii TaxID=79880 RepID=UPI000BA6DBDE|nr:GyrI-like domain-containing protein [Shouchella clausii]PAD41260.1 transcriptional regulator [Bacillus sp. 7520-S]PAD92679.1 transcriptional regulator [Shouchella clausii]